LRLRPVLLLLALALPPALAAPHLDFRVQGLTGPRLRLSDLSGRLSLGHDGHRLRLAPFGLRLGDTPLRGAADLDLIPPHPWRLRMEGKGIDLSALAITPRLPWKPSGRLDLSLDLSAPALPVGRAPADLSGDMRLDGRDITLEGMDLDRFLSRLQDNQDTGLLDLGVLILAGPAGALLIKAADYEGLARAAQAPGSSRLRALHSEVTLKDGRLETRDVALATARHLLVVKGWLDFDPKTPDANPGDAPGADHDRDGPRPLPRPAGAQVPDAALSLDFALVDAHGCPLYREQVRGTLKAPRVVHAGRLLRELLNPVTSVLGQIPKALGARCPEPFYQGVLLPLAAGKGRPETAQPPAGQGPSPAPPGADPVP